MADAIATLKAETVNNNDVVFCTCAEKAHTAEHWGMDQETNVLYTHGALPSGGIGQLPLNNILPCSDFASPALSPSVLSSTQIQSETTPHY